MDFAGSTVLTLSRIVSAYPLHTLKVAMKDTELKSLINLSDLNIASSTEAHRVLSLPLTASTFTDKLKKKGAPRVSFTAAIRVSAVIGKKETRENPDYMELWKYHKYTLQSNAAVANHKKAFWNNNEGMFGDSIAIARAQIRKIAPEVAKLIEAYCNSHSKK